MTQPSKVIDHYGREGLRERLDFALNAAGLGLGPLSPFDLAPLDKFHTGGIEATAELAAAAGIKDGSRIIDIGSGLGGPSRYLAATFDCRVHGFDLNPAFVERPST